MLRPLACARQCRCAAAPPPPPNSDSASRRRSQRLRRPRDMRITQDLQQRLLEKEARLEQQQRLLQAEQEAQEHAAAVVAAQAEQEQAARSLLQQLEAEEGAADAEPAPTAAAGEAAAAAGEAAATTVQAVEPDAVYELQGPQLPGAVGGQAEQQAEASRQAAALLAIMQAGDEVEEVIARCRADIDATTLQLLARRIEAAKQLERQQEIIQGLQLLFRRLKAEVDRQQASPALRLLDELMGILDPGEEDTLAQTATRDERRRQAAARARAAITGGLAGGADVLSLAAQLGSGGGQSVADELVADPVDPLSFLAEATELLRAVEQQIAQLDAVVAQRERARDDEQAVTAEAGGDSGGVAGGEWLSAAEAAVLQVEEVLEQRRVAAGLVQQSLEIVQAVARQLQLEGV